MILQALLVFSLSYLLLQLSSLPVVLQDLLLLLLFYLSYLLLQLISIVVLQVVGAQELRPSSSPFSALFFSSS